MTTGGQVSFKRLYIHDAEDPEDYLVVYWSTSGRDIEGGVAQEKFAAGNVRVEADPGVVERMEFGLQGVDQATEDALEAKLRSKRLLMLRDSRGVRAYGMIGSLTVNRWPNPQVADISISFLKADFEEAV